MVVVFFSLFPRTRQKQTGYTSYVEEFVFLCFVVSLVFGLMSTVPGGLGVFETSALFFLGHSLGAPRLLGVLLVFRMIFTFTPFLIALVAFLVGEWRYRNKKRRRG